MNTHGVSEDPGKIPNRAIRISRELKKKPAHEDDPEVEHDPYSQQKVSPDVPSDEDVRQGEADDEVLPG